MEQDVIVIGGSYAGMAAALQLLRARRRVLVIDAGQRRNRFASQSHGFLGQDGVDPAAIAASARAQLLRYPTLTWLDGLAETASCAKDHFTVTAAGRTFDGHRLLFATGVSDALPDLPGLAERWGQSVFHCPYCHGYELDQGPIAVIGTGPMSVHQAQLLPEWGAVTFFLQGVVPMDDTTRRDLLARGVRIEETPITALDGVADAVLADGRRLSFSGMFTASRTRPATDIAERLGCALQDTPMGQQIRTDDARETSVPGAYACGDAAKMPHSVSLAVGDGAWAGAQLHRSLVWG